MSKPMASADTAGAVRVRVPAVAEQLPVLRAVANTIATSEDFDLAVVLDVTLAVDELCSTLMRRAGRDEMLECQFVVAGDRLLVHGFVGTDIRSPYSTKSLGWRMLTDLVESARTWLDESTAVLHIEMVKVCGTP
jgi:serine/threonine-protein kinase RsbW